MTGTIPGSYAVNGVSKLSWLAASYNPGLYGAWPNGLPPAGFYSTAYYTTGSNFAYYATYNDASSPNMPTAGTGCFTGTSLGLDSPMYVTLRAIAAAVDPNGTQLPSWRTGWQPCKPYATPAQNSSSLMAGKNWAGVGSYCLDGAFAGGTWQTCSSSTVYALGGVQMLVLNSLGLGGTLPVALRELRTLTTLSVWNNSLVGSIPPDWCVWGLCLIAKHGCSGAAGAQGPNCAMDHVRQQHARLQHADVYGLGAQRADGHAAAGAGQHFDAISHAQRVRQQWCVLRVACSRACSRATHCAPTVTGTIPSSYYVSSTSKLSWLAVSYNPSLYGAWPNGLQPAGFASASWSGVGNYYTSSSYFTYNPTSASDSTAGNTVSSGTGCVTATSLGLSQPLWALLRQAAAALDPSGALLPSWRQGIQPCAPYTNPTQSNSSVVYGRSWTGVSAWCQDGGWSAGSWQRCTTSYTSTSIGAVNAIVLNSLGLNGTLPSLLSQVTSLTFIDVSRNVLTGTLPPELANISISLRLSVFDNNGK